MATLRPFLSYSAADRGVVARVAARLVARGSMPIYDLWWLRSAEPDDSATSLRELEMGVGHADGFVYFDSAAARQSMYVKHECDRAMWRTCSDAPELPMVCVLLEDPDAHVPHWFRKTIDWSGSTDREAAISGLLAALGCRRHRAWTARAVRACRELADAADFVRLRGRLNSPHPGVRCEAAILLACLDDGLEPAALAAVVRELGRGLGGGEAERALFALGKLRERSAAAVDDVARFVDGDASPPARARAVRVLGRIGPREDTIAALLRIATRASGVRKAAITELGHMGPAAAAAVPTLVELCASGDRHRRLVALTALGRVGDRSPPVLGAVLAALAETERQGISPSQLHHNAMSVLNQLAPSDSELARALPACRRESVRFAEWLGERYPHCEAAIAGGVPASRLDEELLATARLILSGCRLAGPPRPF